MSLKLKIFVTALLAAILAIFLTDAGKYMQSFYNGLTVWALNVLPALFPFMVISAVIIKVNLFGTLKARKSFTRALFNAPLQGDYIFLISLICGYPVGAKVISERFAAGELSGKQVDKLLTFCSTAGPVFLVGTLGARLLQNQTATVILIVSHFASAILNGLIYRGAFVDISERKQIKKAEKSGDILGEAISGSLLSVLTVGGLVAVFYMLCDMLESFLPAWCQSDGAVLTSYLFGLIEMTNGCIGIAAAADTATATVLCCSLVSFGGLCVLLQCMSFLSKCGVKTRRVLFSKVTQSAIATIVSFALVKLLLP